MFFAEFGVQVTGSRWLLQIVLPLSIKVCNTEVECKQG